MFSQCIGSYEGDSPLQGRFGSGHPGHVKLGIEEGQLAGGHFGRVAGVECVLQGAGAVLGPQTRLKKERKKLKKTQFLLGLQPLPVTRATASDR